MATEVENIDDIPLFQATVGDLSKAIVHAMGIGLRNDQDCMTGNPQTEVKKHYVHGIQGIADLLGCSYATVCRLKHEGMFEGAYSQVKNIIVADADLLLDMYKTKMNVKKML